MTAKQVQIRRGTESECNAATGAQSELFHDTSHDRIRLNDGSTAGGILIPNARDMLQHTLNQASVGGTSDAIELTHPLPFSAWTAGMVLEWEQGSNNTGSVTINPDGLGSKALKKRIGSSFSDLEADDLISGGRYRGTYDGVYVQVDILAHLSGLLSVSQNDLNTSTGSVSGATSGANEGTQAFTANLPGGEYSFAETFKTNNSSYYCYASLFGGGKNQYQRSVMMAASRFLPTIHTYSALNYYFSFNGFDSGITCTARQRYVTASPPYDLGDGETAGFLFLLMNKDGSIAGSYLAEDPPWGHNGPTDTMPDVIDKKTGKKYVCRSRRTSLEKLMRGDINGKRHKTAFESELGKIKADLLSRELKNVEAPPEVKFDRQKAMTEQMQYHNKNISQAAAIALQQENEFKRGVRRGYDMQLRSVEMAVQKQAEKEILRHYAELTHDIKNADMDLIPHPFNNVRKNQTVVLVDPLDARLQDLVQAQEDGEDVSDYIMRGLITVDNQAIDKRRSPKGVKQHALKFKST